MITSSQKVTQVYKAVSAHNSSQSYAQSQPKQMGHRLGSDSFPKEKSFAELLKKELNKQMTSLMSSFGSDITQ